MPNAGIACCMASTASPRPNNWWPSQLTMPQNTFSAGVLPCRPAPASLSCTKWSLPASPAGAVVANSPRMAKKTPSNDDSRPNTRNDLARLSGSMSSSNSRPSFRASGESESARNLVARNAAADWMPVCSPFQPHSFAKVTVVRRIHCNAGPCSFESPGAPTQKMSITPQSAPEPAANA